MPNYFLAVSIELGSPGFRGMPEGNVQGLMCLCRFLGYRLTEKELLVTHMGALGTMTDGLLTAQVCDLAESVSIIREVLGPVLIGFCRIAWWDEREDFWRPVFPGPDDFRPGDLISSAQIGGLRSRANASAAL